MPLHPAPLYRTGVTLQVHIHPLLRRRSSEWAGVATVRWGDGRPSLWLVGPELLVHASCRSFHMHIPRCWRQQRGVAAVGAPTVFPLAPAAPAGWSVEGCEVFLCRMHGTQRPARGVRRCGVRC